MRQICFLRFRPYQFLTDSLVSCAENNAHNLTNIISNQDPSAAMNSWLDYLSIDSVIMVWFYWFDDRKLHKTPTRIWNFYLNLLIFYIQKTMTFGQVVTWFADGVYLVSRNRKFLLISCSKIYPTIPKSWFDSFRSDGNCSPKPLLAIVLFLLFFTKYSDLIRRFKRPVQRFAGGEYIIMLG